MVRRYRSGPPERKPGLLVTDVFGRVWEAEMNPQGDSVWFRREGDQVTGYRGKGDWPVPERLAVRLNEALEAKARLEGTPWDGPRYVMDEDGVTWEARYEGEGEVRFRSSEGRIFVGTIEGIDWSETGEEDLFTILEHSRPASS